MERRLSIFFLLLSVVVSQDIFRTINSCTIQLCGFPSSLPIGKTFQLQVYFNGFNCSEESITLSTQDPWTLADETSGGILGIIGSRNSGLSQSGQKGGFTNGFQHIISNNQTFVIWPIDRSHWVNYNLSTLSISFAGGTSSTVNISVVRNILNDFICKPLSSTPVTFGQTANLTCSISYSGNDTFYNLSVWLRDSLNVSSLQVFSLGDQLITKKKNFSILYNITSVPVGPNGIRVQTWLQYDSWTYNSTLHNYPQTLYLSGDINLSDSRGYNISFGASQSHVDDYNLVTTLVWKDGSSSWSGFPAYCIITQPPTWNGGWLDASDHTGDGNSTLLVLDPLDKGDVFTKTFNVTPGTYYLFSFYVLNMGISSAAPQLYINITHSNGNSKTTPQLDTPTIGYPRWNYFSFLFLAETNQVNVTLYDSFPGSGGNDFAVDDLSLYPVDESKSLTLSFNFLRNQLDQLIASNATVSEADAKDMMSGLMNSTQSNGSSFFQLLDDLTTVMLRGRDNYTLTAGNLSLSGIKVDKKNASVDLSAGRAQVKITGQVMSQILQAQNRTASVIMSATAVNTLSTLNQTELYSDVIGLSLIDSDGTEISVKNTEQPIVFTLTASRFLPPNHTYTCLYFDASTKSWNNINTSVDVDIITCSTDHLTNFSVGVSPVRVDRPSTPGEKSTFPSIYIIAAVVGGCSLIIIAIVIIVVVSIVRRRRRMRYDPTEDIKMQVFSSGSIRVGERISGRVYRGHPDTSDMVAVKELTEKSELKNKREVQAYLRVRHPQIVQYLSTYTDEAKYMVMTYMPMGTLLDYVEKNDDKTGLTKILMDVASALIYMHENDLVHCNLSASKVLLYSENDELRGKVCSLGYSRRPCVLNKGDIAELSPRWMAPELLSDGRCTYKSDVWSFGMMLYECMQSGTQPYSESREEEVRERVERGPNLQPAKDWPPLMRRTYTECTNREAGRRPKMPEVADMLREGPFRGETTIAMEDHDNENLYNGSMLMSNRGYRPATKLNPLAEA
ncbi:tyrosine-protein kinase Fer-like isoform 2 [Planoprotostelium fungivorum]|uniref:Tyrosine-protein kinase Fer-like isoform 2 n=1 Tax=Planoprotostelium fungivorum TaxID=1890364 RepID=A0A2P6MRH3_9EUKA|nr:tyrosine-protein kinase Fer-like isoform 2 [Planoprotostelium fungivorum]